MSAVFKLKYSGVLVLATLVGMDDEKPDQYYLAISMVSYFHHGQFGAPTVKSLK